MNIVQTELSGVVIIELRAFQDVRGYFFELFQAKRYQQQGLETRFVQDNCSRSSKNVLRGLHYQLKHPQGKLIYVTRGQVLDVIVDVRVGSPTFGKAITIELSEKNFRQVYIPPGFAHGFYVFSEWADFIYKCTAYYSPQDEYGLRWNDPDLHIAWPIKHPIVSEKDAIHPYLKDIPKDQLPRFLSDE
ncbi:MAG: dTDP-4-dehydrorhamnose 3,5-epimerase [Gammaproteobacteria bacterium]|jgi:dTDP-4-dehydrorhamnose 3,5-epimerase|nr:dTDP-4-dehydrorhamnose 3,5-epimerase [Gammaproteobacteria bacterium]